MLISNGNEYIVKLLQYKKKKIQISKKQRNMRPIEPTESKLATTLSEFASYNQILTRLFILGSQKNLYYLFGFILHFGLR